MSRDRSAHSIAPAAGADVRRAQRRARASGFTLIELTVALVAGLLVAMAVATLSHESTATFNEEIRISAAEATLRTAADRLRADLQRASYMSTPNIEMDPSITRPFGQTAALPSNATAAAKTLQGILFTPGTTGYNANNGLTLETVNGLTPASVDITGNLTTADAFEVQTKAVVGSCCRVQLAASSPSMYRLLNSNSAGTPDKNAETEIQNIFAPAPAPNGATGTTNAQFWVRYTDTVTNKSEYILTCNNAGQPIASMGLIGTVIQPFVLLAQCPMVGSTTEMTVTNGNTGGTATINPVITARWEVVAPGGGGTPIPAQDIAALDNSPLEAGPDANKYDLVRSIVDGNGNLLPQTTEIIAEYVVGFDLAFSVDTQAGTTGASPTIQPYDFGDVRNANTAATVAPLLTTPVNGPATPDPQRIRAIKFMLATRAAIPDRASSIPVATVGDGGGGTFLYRYCMNPGNCTGNKLVQWARVRTLVSEVALPNQQQAFF